MFTRRDAAGLPAVEAPSAVPDDAIDPSQARLAAIRETYLIQNYPREMGSGVIVMMREIDAPVRVFGKHWGGLRTAYKI